MKKTLLKVVSRNLKAIYEIYLIKFNDDAEMTQWFVILDDRYLKQLPELPKEKISHLISLLGDMVECYAYKFDNKSTHQAICELLLQNMRLLGIVRDSFTS